MPAKKKASQTPDHPLADVSMMCLEDVAAFLRRERTAVYRLLKNDSDFPRPIYIRSTPYWLTDELRQYLKARADERPSVRRAGALAATTAATE